MVLDPLILEEMVQIDLFGQFSSSASITMIIIHFCHNSSCLLKESNLFISKKERNLIAEPCGIPALIGKEFDVKSLFFILSSANIFRPDLSNRNDSAHCEFKLKKFACFILSAMWIRWIV
ncbi:hypothetical protein BpHYR1_045604 [Brachionus plicatilis]|uniref:Uncharacterized protein n=1 Tax=Brachionus plicatilis TaxID=10195 RepID=A0A3M7S6R6_BRAPC|nr:hypothetical protein BpHYR1_045604 [Brachionus plicatilis]